ncbi:uncharacterized protein KNAG_0G03360 [Huiozyma naganishii CBS 8797]|uniref:Uncharacterized protein n=1 Tax=Huiozyma naganishii (strain ATCC MYA-139 / BCRC 22969 / CBS 8797 / KCTC 17520 / NBRC 10181 / NCYC 3082 / Yp74L-3) TaxID=1071383 RepID=J7S877_HUIN7|nr:hypothetical protein KNAG_0G03360 [Kazachstania naganishii CBS 8797]CCK71394.1 hypothetical protein KNAG_0G03360 [Kazachstania naganishii CBS 8797]
MVQQGDDTYRMLILVEEPLEDDVPTTEVTSEDGSQPIKSTHEYIDELHLPFGLDELDALNEWFDKFDEEICIPNEGHIKYEISSDGLIVLMLGKEIEHVYEQIKSFIETHQ